jgi:multicomponent Na+:H+ antiporter subunit C
MAYLMYAVAGWVFLWGLYGIISSRNLVCQCICLTVLQTSTYILLFCIGYRTGGTAPVFADIPVGTLVVDPVVQSVMLTDVVVEAMVLASRDSLSGSRLIWNDLGFSTSPGNTRQPWEQKQRSAGCGCGAEHDKDSEAECGWEIRQQENAESAADHKQ